MSGREPRGPGVDGTGGRTPDGARLRLARLAHGLSQQELAAAAGVTRQAIAGFETGQWDPSLRVALALARSLTTSVEELFGPAPTMASLDAVCLSPLEADRCRVDVGQVGEHTVALPLTGNRTLRAGFTPSAATATASAEDPSRCQVHPSAPPRPSLVIAGCDPALPLLGGPLSRLDRPVELLWWPCGSREALRLAAAGLVHVAGFHLDAEADTPLFLSTLDAFQPADFEVVTFASWREGLAIRPELASTVIGLDDVARNGLRLVNREPGAEARDLLDTQMQRLGIESGEIVGYNSAASGHLLVAATLAAEAGDVGITTEPAALSYGLAFIPIARERSLLAIPRQLITAPEVQSLLRILAAPALQGQVASLPGYDDVQSCGTRISSS